MIFTKVDQVKTLELHENLQNALGIMQEMKSVCLPYIHAVSSLNKHGIDTLQLDIASIVMHKFVEEEVEAT